jgi:uncharacterized membrane protein
LSCSTLTGSAKHFSFLLKFFYIPCQMKEIEVFFSIMSNWIWNHRCTVVFKFFWGAFWCFTAFWCPNVSKSFEEVHEMPPPPAPPPCVHLWTWNVKTYLYFILYYLIRSLLQISATHLQRRTSINGNSLSRLKKLKCRMEKSKRFASFYSELVFNNSSNL